MESEAKASPSPLARAGSLPIRAPVSAEETEPYPLAPSDCSAEDEGFETASDPDDDSARPSAMPIAKVSGDDDVEVEEEVAEDAEEEEADGDGVAGVPAGNPRGRDLENPAEDGVAGDRGSGGGACVEVGEVGASEGSMPEGAAESKRVEAVEIEKDGEAAEGSNPVKGSDFTEKKKDGASGGSNLEKGTEQKPVEVSDVEGIEKGGEAGAAGESKPVGAVYAVEVEKDGASDGSKLEEEAVVSKAVEASVAAELEMDEAAGSTSSSSSSSSVHTVEKEADLSTVELQELNAPKDDEAEAAGVAQSGQNHDEVTVPAAKALELECVDAKTNLGEVQSEENLGCDSASLEPKATEDSNDKIDGNEAEKEEDSNGNAVNESNAAASQEAGSEQAAERASICSNVEPREIREEPASDGSQLNSACEVSFSDREAKHDADGTPAVDDAGNAGQAATEEEEGLAANSPARVATLEGSEAAKQIIKELEEGSSGTSSHSGFRISLQDYSQNIDGQIVTDSDEEVDTDEEGDGTELFDSAALAALLKAATGASDGGVTVGSSDGTRIFSVDRPAGLGSSVTSLKPGPARSTRPTLLTPSDLAVVGEPENNMDEEEKKLHEKVEHIRVKFLRLVQRLGHSPEDTVAAQVLYRLSLAEGIRRGRQLGRAFSLENAKKKAFQLEVEGTEDMDFSCNILILGKTGVGKSATINSIFGEEKSHTNAFKPATNSVREISGVVDGVKIRVLDTPGLRASVMDQASNRKILSNIKKYTKRCPPDIVLYVDRLDTQTRDFNDLPLLRSITATLGSSIWFNAIVALTHAASAPPDGPNGSPLSYEVFIAQRSHVVQHSIRQAAGDMRLMNPVALVENHPSCRRNREGQRVLPNGLSWRPQLLLLCYSSKILSEANALLKLQDPSPGKLFGFRLRSPPLPFLLSSLLQSRQHPKLANDQGIDNGDSDIDLDDFSDTEQEEDEDDYDSLPPFKPLKKAQIAKLTKEQRRAYFEEYDYRVKLLQKKQWKEEIKRLREMKKRGKSGQDEFAYGDMAEDYDQDGAPAAVPVPLPDMVLPPSFDGDNPAFRYRFLEPTSQLLTRPVLDTHGWDHDCGYDGVSLEESLAVVGRFPAAVAVQITKDKKEFNIHLDSSIAAKHGENGSTLAGFDIQSVGRQLAYILRSETKFKNLKKNKTTAGISVTFLGETVATGLKIEDQVTIGKRVSLVASTGAVRAQGDTAYGANLEARLREKDYPIGQVLSTLGLSLMRWRGDLALGANLQSQFALGRNSKVAVRAGLNNKLSGQITVKTSTSEQLQIALVGILPVAVTIFRSIWPGEAYLVH